MGIHLTEQFFMMGFLQLAYVGTESIQGCPDVVECAQGGVIVSITR